MEWTLNEFQKFCVSRAGEIEEIGHQMALGALGLAGETGEVAELLIEYNAVYGLSSEQRDKLCAELSDVLWYIVYTANAIGLDMETLEGMPVPRITVLQDQILLGLMLTCKTGKVTDLIKKCLYHGHALDTRKVGLALSEVFFYLVYVATMNHLTLAEIMVRQVAKLNKRYPNGFDPKISQARQK